MHTQTHTSVISFCEEFYLSCGSSHTLYSIQTVTLQLFICLFVFLQHIQKLYRVEQAVRPIPERKWPHKKVSLLIESLVWSQGNMLKLWMAKCTISVTLYKDHWVKIRLFVALQKKKIMCVVEWTGKEMHQKTFLYTQMIIFPHQHAIIPRKVKV